MPDFENIEAYETRERSGKRRISPVAPHSLRPIDFILRPARAGRRKRGSIPLPQPPAIDIEPIDSRDLEREFRAADRAARAESRRRHGGSLARAWKRLRRFFRSLFSFGGKRGKTVRGKGGKFKNKANGPERGRKNPRGRGGKATQARGGDGPGGKGKGPGPGGGQRPRKPRGRRKPGPDGREGSGARGAPHGSSGQRQDPPRAGASGSAAGEAGGPKKRQRRNRRNRGGGKSGGPNPPSTPAN